MAGRVGLVPALLEVQATAAEVESEPVLKVDWLRCFTRGEEETFLIVSSPKYLACTNFCGVFHAPSPLSSNELEEKFVPESRHLLLATWRFSLSLSAEHNIDFGHH